LLSAERSSVADLAHRLRTPLTAVRLSAETLPESERLAGDLDQLERTLNHVINEARRPVREGGGAVSDLAAIASARATFWGVLADEQDRTWQLSVDDGPHVVLGHPDDLTAAVDALIGNVLAHTPKGTSYLVDVETGDSFRRLVVTDRGPGFDFAPEPGLSSADSTGIGIDIVRRTAAAHGGWLDIGQADGGGAKVTVHFAAGS